MFESGHKFGKYEIVRLLGEGGMGLVFLAKNAFGGMVVLKMLLPELATNEEIRERFMREGTIQNTLRHAHIVRVVDIVEDDGVPALVMDYMPGRDLEEAIAAGQNFTIPEIVEMSGKVLDALHSAHEHGFIHRDIKPSNIFLEEVGVDYEPRVMDFGIAKIQEAAALTQAQQFFGTLHYASPEQIRSTKDVDRRTDVYSYGVLVWQLLSGQAPFAYARSHVDVMKAVVYDALPRLPDEVPEWLRDAVDKATEKDVARRFASAREFQRALDEGLEREERERAGGATKKTPWASGIFNKVKRGKSGEAPDVKDEAVEADDGADPWASSPPARDSAEQTQLGKSKPGSGEAPAAEPAEDPPSRGADDDGLPGESVGDSDAIAVGADAAVVDDEPPATPRKKARDDSRGKSSSASSGRPTVAPAAAPTRALPQKSLAERASEGLTFAINLVIVFAILGVIGFFGYRYMTRTDRVPDDWVRIEPGSFPMGSPEDELGRSPDEARHVVSLSYPFAIMRYEVTQELWLDVTYGQPANFSRCGPECPVEMVSWYDAVEFANFLSDRDGLDPCYRISGDSPNPEVTWPEGLACEGYRLPTEAEWEYAARAGASGSLYIGSLTETRRRPVDPQLDPLAWYGGNSIAEYEGAIDCSTWGEGMSTCGPKPVGRKTPNAHGMFDVLGNVAEWVWDYHDPLPPTDQADPTGPDSGTRRVVRGGSWWDPASGCRLASRSGSPPVGRFNIGFRLARTLRR